MNILRLLLPVTLLLGGCSSMPDLIQFHDDKPAYAKGTGTAGPSAASREALQVPPELREELELPMADQVATVDEKLLPRSYQQAVTGEAISLDARAYPQRPAQVFSAVVDAMTSLNIPVQSVDSPSGIITSDWIRAGADSLSVMGGLLGDEGTYTKHRFIVRVYRSTMADKVVSKLEIRVHGQIYKSRHWINTQMNRNVAKELFSATEEQLTRMQRGGSLKLSD